MTPTATFPGGETEAPLLGYPGAVTVRIYRMSPDERRIEFREDGFTRGGGALHRDPVTGAFVGDVLLWAGTWRGTAVGRVLTLVEPPAAPIPTALRIPLVDDAPAATARPWPERVPHAEGRRYAEVDEDGRVVAPR